MNTNTHITNPAYARVIEHFGSLTAAADALNERHNTVANWRVRGIPARQAIKIESLSNGELKAAELVMPPEPSGDQAA